MVDNVFEYIDYLVRNGLQRNTAGSYRHYLEAVVKNLSIIIDSETISSEDDINKILTELKHYYADSYVSNCGTALRKYLAFVKCNKADFSYPDELKNYESYPEGAIKKITINYYERKKENRNRAIACHGLNCFVCDFNFEKTYGDLGAGYIHIHHRTPLHKIKKQYKVDIRNDLVPVCPNCHAMLHRMTPPLTIEKLKNIMENANK